MSRSIKLAAVGYINRNPVAAAPWDDLAPLARRLRDDFADLFVGRASEDIDQAFLAGRLTFSFFEGKIVGEFEGGFIPAIAYSTLLEKDSE